MHLKLPSFALGLILGLLIGLIGGFVIHSVLKFSDSDFETTDTEEQITAPKRVKSEKADRMSVDDTPDESLLLADSITDSGDQTMADTSYGYSDDSNGEDIIVAKDEFLSGRTLSVIGDSIIARSGKNLDSLLIGEKGSNLLPRKYRVEFWKSPVNYRGYRLQKDVLVVYGIDDFEDAALKRSDGKLFLIAGNRAFMLEESPQYQPLSPSRIP